MGFFRWIRQVFLSLFHLSPRRRRRRRHYPKDLRVAMQRINNIRKRHGVKPIPIDDRALNLENPAPDLLRYHFFAHVSPKSTPPPEGKFGFELASTAENLFGGRSTDMYRQLMPDEERRAPEELIVSRPHRGGNSGVSGKCRVYWGKYDRIGCGLLRSGIFNSVPIFGYHFIHERAD